MLFTITLQWSVVREEDEVEQEDLREGGNGPLADHVADDDDVH